MTIETRIIDLAQAARTASGVMAAVSRKQKDAALTAIAGLLRTQALHHNGGKSERCGRSPENRVVFRHD
jgi:hypothetical protein